VLRGESSGRRASRKGAKTQRKKKANTVTKRLRQVVADTFNVPLEQVPEDAEMGALEPWTSLGHLELMMAVEMEFRVKIPSDAMLDLVSLPALQDFLTSQGVTDA
jgi:acyl carrier protein